MNSFIKTLKVTYIREFVVLTCISNQFIKTNPSKKGEELFTGLMLITGAGRIIYMGSPYKVFLNGDNYEVTDLEGVEYSFTRVQTGLSVEALKDKLNDCNCYILSTSSGPSSTSVEVENWTSTGDPTETTTLSIPVDKSKVMLFRLGVLVASDTWDRIGENELEVLPPGTVEAGDTFTMIVFA